MKLSLTTQICWTKVIGSMSKSVLEDLRTETQSSRLKKSLLLGLEQVHPRSEGSKRSSPPFSDEDLYDGLRTLFRQYAYNGAGDAFTMDVGEWEMLCKDAGILGTKGMTFGKVDTIFIAANYAAKAAKKNSEKKSSKLQESHLGNPDNAFTLFEFIEALCRLAMAMSRTPSEGTKSGISEVPPALRVQDMLVKHIMLLAKKCQVEWHLFEEIEHKAARLLPPAHERA